MNAPFQTDPEQFAAICATCCMRKLSIFGSAVRDDFDEAHSHIDNLVEIEDLPVQGYATNFLTRQDSLIHLYGRSVDLLTDSSIRNSFLRKPINRDRVLLYAA